MSDQVSASKTINDLNQVKALLEQVQVSLQSQKDILKQRGMNLPPMVLNALASSRAELTNLESKLVGEQTELRQLQALAELSASITTSLELNDVLEEAMDIVIALTGAERGFILLLQADNSFHFRVIRDSTLPPGDPRLQRQPEISKTILQHVVNTREPLLADNAFQDDRFIDGESVANFSLRSVLCVPLMYRSQLTGLVYVDNRLQAAMFTEREKRTLTAFANTAAVSIANAQYYTEIQEALTEITQVQALMNNVFESIGSGLIATNADEIITTFNRAAQQMLAWKTADVIGAPLQDVLRRIKKDLREELDNLQDDAERHTLEAQLPRADGGRISLAMKLSPLRDTENAVHGIAIVMDDVSAKREREQELRVMKTYLPPEMVDQIHEISQLDLGGVRRDVTCVFAEVRPLATLKDHEPKAIMSILNEYLALAADCVAETGGIVDKYMGNEVMALWNTQLNMQDNHAQHAIDCALLMRERFHERYHALGLDPDTRWYRIGMHTGVATLGNVGSAKRRDFTAIGDTINLAKRLEENSRPGQIILSDATLHQLQATGDATAFHFEARTPILGKGKSTPTPVYEVFKAHD